MESLLRLHQVDSQVRGLRSRQESAERYLRVQQTQLDRLEQQANELAARKRHVQATTANLETEVAVIDERIEKLRNELNSAETNKQYTAVLTELNTVKVNRSELEERILNEMEMIETLGVEEGEIAGQTDERRKVRDVAKDQLDERRNEIGERLAELETERAQAATSVPGNSLAVFEHIADMYEGEALAEVDEIDRRRRDYACGACHMTVPFEHIASLVGGREDLVRCTACERILYLHDEMRGTLAKK
ncbi:MAG: zinc ribbon domain-containing protein [Planctomycetota bacterium]